MASINGRVIPGDICGEILSWLPAKEVHRCRNISRAFDASSRDHAFFAWQSHRAKDDTGVFLRRHDGRFEMVFTDACSGLPPESLEFLKGGDKRILGSHGGLVLFDVTGGGHDQSSGFYLYNPVRRALHRIPPPEDARIISVMTCGLVILFADQGDGEDVDYEIVCMTPTSEWGSRMVCWLYSSREEGWKLIGDRFYVGPRNIQFHSPVVSSQGTIYLASDCGRYQREEPYIVAVDINAGTSRILPLPEEIGSPSSDFEQVEIVGHGGGSLSLIQFSTSASEFKIWEIKDPDELWVWERRGQVIMASMGLKPRPIHGCTLINSDVLVFTIGEDVYVYHVKDAGQVRIVKGDEGCCRYMCPYVNTFRLCGRVEEDEFCT